MGRPFEDELAELEETHRWACEAPVESLAEHVREFSQRPLLAVGSGGSYSTAAFATTLFRKVSSNFAFAVTPQELSAQRHALRQSSVLIATASGSNTDAIGVLKIAAFNDAVSVLAICTKIGSKLAAEGAKFSSVSVEEFDVPSPGDGFLAMNSLWASAVLLCRAFDVDLGLTTKIPKRLSKIVDASRWNTFVTSIAQESALIWERETTIILYGPTSYAAAVDLESKLTEAALTNVWIADYRHFAHGRHHWIAKHRDQTSIVAFIEEAEADLADRTLAEIPSDVPVFAVNLTSDPLGMLRALAHVFPLTAAAGQAAGIDPGRPGVPSFGRRIYRLNAYGKLAPKNSERPSLKAVAIERKSRTSIELLERRGRLQEWTKAYEQFVESLSKARFSSVVLDYDGTICNSAERRTGIRSAVEDELVRLLDSGLAIGIATGRGKSVREALCCCIDEQYWSQVTVGYYNGGQIARLSELDAPDGTPKVGDLLLNLWSELQNTPRLQEIASLEGRFSQISIEAKEIFDVEECWQVIMQVAAEVSPGSVKVCRSSHSFDLIPAHVSKLDVLAALSSDAATRILTIGDMGEWPGNDSELLSHEFSLSVDQVSSSLSTCWNLASQGVRGVEATLEYLGRLHVGKNGLARLKLPHKTEGHR